jgi:hypothetical protein
MSKLIRPLRALSDYPVIISKSPNQTAEQAASYYGIPEHRIERSFSRGIFYTIKAGEIIEFEGGNGYDTLNFLIPTHEDSRLKWPSFIVQRGSFTGFLKDSNFEKLY